MVHYCILLWALFDPSVTSTFVIWNSAESSGSDIRFRFAESGVGAPAGGKGTMGEITNVMEYQAIAEQKLPKMAYDYYASGAEDEWTLKENREAFSRIL